MWGCKAHWFTLPKVLRDRIWATYRRGQEITKRPSAEYIQAAKDVQEWIGQFQQNMRPHGARSQMRIAKAITICQPFAHLIQIGQKRVENRSWKTAHRGQLYIHAGKSREWLNIDDDGKDYGIEVSRMAFGAIVAIANLVDCVHIDQVGKSDIARKYPWLKDHEHTSGPWCWVFGESVTPIGPWPWRGAQQLWDIDEEELNRVATKQIDAAPVVRGRKS